MYNCTRQILRTAVAEIATFNLRTILFGVEDLSIVENKKIFTTVHELIRESGLCRCRKIESNQHFFFLKCGLYNCTRQILRTAVAEIATFNLRTILFGVEDLSIVENKKIFTANL